ncbi:hypothetical protein F5Y06DRAFT_51082 [Hypoxylon sp. FL0890]|nr:hypothetical protein F5Y06DRAFT_51082 [Hypoxylon sp. FL0890]
MAQSTEQPMTGRPSNVASTNQAMPNTARNQPSSLYYNLDDPWMSSPLYYQPPITSSTGTVSSYFRSVSLRPLGIWFRDLSDYGEVIEESSEKLVIRLRHRDPTSLMIVVWRAWVTKYLADGILCSIHFGPLIPYQTVEVVFQNHDRAMVPTRRNHMVRIQRASASSTTTSESNVTASSVDSADTADTVYTIRAEDGVIPPGPAQQLASQHPLVDYDYFGELTAQFVQLLSRFPALAFQVSQAAPFYHGYQAAPSYHGYQVAPFYRGVPAYQGAQGDQGGRGQQENRDQEGQEGQRGSRGGRGRGRGRYRGGNRGRGDGRDRYQPESTSLESALVGGRERGVKRPREDATDDGSKGKRNKRG